MAKTYLIGVDLGTMGTKAASFDTEGNLVADAYEESKLYYPKPGWVEQDRSWQIHNRFLKLGLLQSWGNPVDGEAGETYLGLEYEGEYCRFFYFIGAYLEIAGDEERRTALLSCGIGLGLFSR